MSDSLAVLSPPVLSEFGTTPGWVANRGGDVRAYDRRQQRHVYGPSHPFRRTTDILVTNGLLRFWVGNRLLPAFLNVEAFVDGSWRAVGVLMLSEDVEAGNTLVGARLLRVTPDVATVVCDVDKLGPVYVSLHRGERGVRIVHGDGLRSVSAARTVRWTGTRPAVELSGITRDTTGDFDSSAAITSSGRARYFWPPDQPVTQWSVRCSWLPQADDSTAELDDWGGVTGEWGEGDWGGGLLSAIVHLFSLEDSDGTIVGQCRFDGPAGARIVFELGAHTIQSAPITFDADDVVRICAAFSTTGGMALTTRVASDPPATLSNATYVDPGTDEAAYTVIAVGPDDDSSGEARLDQVGIFEDRLDDDERAAVLTQTSRTASLPDPEGRMIWFEPFDVDIAPTGAFASGRTAGGVDPWGLTRLVCALKTCSALGLGVSKSTDVFEVGAFLTTGASKDAPADVHAQFAADRFQEVRVR